MDQLRKAKREQDEEIARVKMFIDRFRYQATKASQVQSRIKMLGGWCDRGAAGAGIHFTLSCAKSGRTVFDQGDPQGLRRQRDFAHARPHIERGDRLALVGPNGGASPR
jgi:ATP-binding cassette subfamily F protein 3